MNLGLDIGSVSVKLAFFDDNRLERVRYVRHQGRPLEVLVELLKHERGIERLAVTGGGAGVLGELVGGQVVNEIVATVEGLALVAPQLRTIIEIGGEDSKLFVIERELKDFTTNTICAAGTGIFLDQQAHRLNLTIEEFSELACRSRSPARIAGRCSVFAKSDMIHLQQIGTPMEDIIAGLCGALARNFKSVIARGKNFEPPIGFVGGVASNQGLVRAFESVLGLEAGELVVPDYFNCLGAVGAWRYSAKSGAVERFQGLERLTEYMARPVRARTLSPLDGSGLILPERRCSKRGSCPRGYLGIDVGSVSTNLVLLDDENRVVSRYYLWTQGNPIKAVKTGLEQMGRELEGRVEIAAVGTTGSGRYLAGDFVGADIIKNEITAQARAAVECDPEVDTIFEIGGQDSKFVSLERGVVTDFEMNKVCAAGTGSFLEEQAKILDVEIEDFGELALQAKAPVFLGERCTVFMESEMLHHQHLFTHKRDILAGLAYSIAENYLNRVVQGKRIGRRILFQGGVAANKAVIAAFEKILGRRVVVPENFDVTGAIGAAIIARESRRNGTRFKGFGLARRQYESRTFECSGCTNLCDISAVEVVGEKPLYYGGRCEKYERSDQEKRTGMADHFRARNDLFFRTEPVGGPKVGIPRTLVFYELFPFFHRFLRRLGFDVVLSECTNKSIARLGTEHSPVETCFPVKAANGHVLDLVGRGVKQLFLPSVISVRKSPGFESSYVCPYVQTLPYSVRASLGEKLAGVDILAPVFDFDAPKGQMIRKGDDLLDGLGASERAVRAALEDALEYQVEVNRAIAEQGRAALEQAADLTFVIVSRPYNGYDQGVNLDLVKKIGQLGVQALPLDYLPLPLDDIRSEFANMYWHYGQKLLAAASSIRRNKKLYGVYVSNFSCGPDSFLVRYFKELMGEKPFLLLELDEHSADAGLVTRLEAFLDSIKGKENTGPARAIRTEKRVRKDKKVYIPYMCDHALIFDAALHSVDVNSQVMPESDEATLVCGRQYTTGRECFPAILTSGDMIKVTRRADFEKGNSAFFMPQGSGPCRFGQYHRLHRIILDELGCANVPILSPNQGPSLFEDLGPLGYKFVLRAWAGIVGIDCIDALARKMRPREKEAGETDRRYRELLNAVCAHIERGQSIVGLLRRAGKELRGIPVREGRMPRIGIVGEIFVRANAFSNNYLVKNLEALGCEVMVPPISEWFMYLNFTRTRRALWRKQYGRYVKNRLIDAFMGYEEARMYRQTGLEVELDEHELLAHARPYMHHTFEGEAILSVGKTIDFIKRGADGVINVMPFTCMPGNIVAIIYRKLKDDFKDFPLLILSFDGLEHATDRMRLEAFVHQAKMRMGD